jgi:hypothetical protein
MRVLVLTLVLATALSAAAKPRAVRHPAPPAPVNGPTFSKEVVRIFQEHCQTCHREGDIAPFALTSYAEAKPYATLIKFMTMSKQMPPWKPTEGCGEFLDERRLTAQEIATLSQWADNGAPEGNRSDLPQPRSFDSGWELGEPDFIAASAEAYTPAEHGDTYRCFTIPTNYSSMKYVRAIDTHPDDRETVHHVISFVDTTGESQALDEKEPGPGYTCFGGPGFDLPGTLGGWAPGQRPLELPEGTAFELPPGARIVLQVHYHPHHGTPKPDRTAFGVYFADKEPRAIMRILPIINQNFTIPPHDSNYKVVADFPIPTPFQTKLWLVAPHMHLLGRKMKVEMTKANGQTECLIDIQDWDFNWQGAYRYKQPITIPAGTRLRATAYYDNSTGNPRNPNNPPRPVSWGEETTDEMCIAFVGVTVE